MQVPKGVKKLQELNSTIEILITNYSACKNHDGKKYKISKNTLELFDITIGYLEAIREQPNKYEKYHTAYSKKISGLIQLSIDGYQDNVYVQSCLEAVAKVDKIMEGELNGTG